MGLFYEEMFFGVGYDLVYVFKVVLIFMIFILCENGISYNEVENVILEDIIVGC